MKRTFLKLTGALALGFLFAATAPLHATATCIGPADCDLTIADFSGSAQINGAFFNQMDAKSTGTGLIDSFVQIGGANKDVVQAYNTTVNNTLNNGASDQFNHALSISIDSLPQFIGFGGVVYREFNLDINQAGNGDARKLTLDDVQIFLTNTPNASTTTIADPDLGKLIYRMDDGGDSTILLDFQLNDGSGSGDMTMLVPESFFAPYESGINKKDYVVLYSKFGGDLFNGTQYANNDGFEEWFVCKDKTTQLATACTGTQNGHNTDGGGGVGTPEPASMVLFGMGLILGAGRLSKRAKRKD
jgi:hypothetical protein